MTSALQAPQVPSAAASRFCIVAAQRTGSTLLVRSLDSSPLVFCAGEIFHDGPNVHRPEWRLPPPRPGVAAIDRLLGGRMLNRRIKRHLTRYFASAGGEARAVGFKVMTSQLRWRPHLLPLLAELGVTPFFLYRRDSFATALSYAIAKFTNVFHSDRAQDPPSEARVNVPAAEFEVLLQKCLRSRQEVLILHRERGGMLLAYEDMIRDWAGVIGRIGDQLGLHDLRVDQALDKLGHSRQRIVVANEDELRNMYPVESAT